jgi:hypothetical protein
MRLRDLNCPSRFIFLQDGPDSPQGLFFLLYMEDGQCVVISEEKIIVLGRLHNARERRMFVNVFGEKLTGNEEVREVPSPRGENESGARKDPAVA